MAGIPTPLSRILPHSSATLLANLRRQQQWLDRIRGRLPQVLAQHCNSCTLSGSTLLLYTDAPAWSFQLRFAVPKLLQELQGEGAAVTAVEIRVATPPPEPRSRPARLPSPDVTELIQSYSSGADDDPLNQALRRLGGTLDELHRRRG
jgi:hypothetical protein